MITKSHNRLYATMRSLSVLIAFQIMAGFIGPALWVLYEPASIISKMASLSSSSTALAICWLVSAACIMPFATMQIFAPTCRYRRVIIKLSNFGMIGGACAWVLLSFVGRNLDYDFAIGVYISNAVIAFLMAGVMANSLNNDQKELNKNLESQAHEA